MSLAVTYADIRREIGLLTGLGRDPDAWDQDDRDDVEGIIRRGLRRVYYYSPAEGKERHVWTFMRPVATVALKLGTAAYELPEDFAELVDGGVSLSAGGLLARVSEEQIRALPATSGVPAYCALRVRPISVGGQTRQELVLYPTPDDEAVAASPTLSLRYAVVPQELSADNPYPLGGAVHGECFLEACLAEAERTLNDEDGIHSKRFADCLTSSIAIDLKLDRPDDNGIWPLENPADGLTVNKAYLKRLIGRQLKLGPHAGLWTDKQAQEVKSVLETGLRKFYNPIILPGERKAHDWSFLRPLLTIQTQGSEFRYDLPADFAMMEGPLTYAPGAAVLYPPIRQVGETKIRMYLQRQEASARPYEFAVAPKDLDPSGVTRWEMLLWPVPDQEYDLRGRYQVNPEALGEEVTLPFGGQPHAQTVVEACLSAAEESVGTGQGLHTQKFLECLKASVARDREASSPDTLGYSRDPSDIPGMGWDHHDLDENLVTYNGQVV